MTRTTDLERENRLLKQRLGLLTEEAAKNEAILKRSRQREMGLLESESLHGLLRLLVQGLADSYGLQAVTLFVGDPDHEVRHLLMNDDSGIEGVYFVDVISDLTPVPFIRPWLGPYTASLHHCLFPDVEKPRSVALIPLLRKHKLVGSLNFGSTDESRFTRYHATDFLYHLGTIGSFCLENVVNREKLVRSGFTDVLTGWYNRRYLQDRLPGELARAQRNQQPLACLLLDIDHFKSVNDSHGHLVGDAVLRNITRRIESQIRASDIAARFGGEEFTVLLPNTQTTEALDLAERVRAYVAGTPIEVEDGLSLSITLSVGVASVVPQLNKTDLAPLGRALLASADKALYQAKLHGRNCVRTSHNPTE
ncbi:MAG: DUF484 family protein [Arenicellales bacterium]|nr:DUF484 family protein [Arenicellales bacterium]